MHLLMKRLTKPQASHKAGLWLEYSRLLGTPTLLSTAGATLLHGFYCELSDEPIHWGTAVLIISACLSMVTVFWSVAFWRRAYIAGWLAACAILLSALLLNSLSADVCEVHQGFLSVLSGMCAGISVIVALSKPIAEVHSPTSPGEQMLDSEAESQATMECDSTRDSFSVTTDASEPVIKRRFAKGQWLVGTLLLGGFLMYMVVVPAVAMLWEQATPRPAVRRELTEMSLDEYFRLHTVSGVIMVMFLAMGASVGSFLNVVIFRLPRGRKLLWPPSACAACDTRIAGRDNIPILAWLNLGGRCRHCGVAIAARYAGVEALVAAVFVVFFYRELLSGGENLPVRTTNVYRGIVWILFYTKWDLLTLYVFHMSVLILLLSWGMINLDRFRVPTRTILFSLLSIGLLVVLAPHLNPLLSNVTPHIARQSAVYSCLLGGGLGGLVGWGLAIVFKVKRDLTESELLEERQLDADRSNDDGYDQNLYGQNLYGQPAAVPVNTTDMAASLALLGAAMGYQATLCVAMVTAALAGAWRLASLVAPRWPVVRSAQAMPITLILFAVAVIHLMFWKPIHALVQQTGLP